MGYKNAKEFMKIRAELFCQMSSQKSPRKTLPSLRQLAEEFSVSHPTVMRAVHSLIEDGFLAVEKKGGYRSLLDSADQAKRHIYGLINGIGNYSFEFKTQWELNIPLVRSLFARGSLFCTKNIFLDKPENLQAAVYENGLSGILLSGSNVKMMEEAQKLKDRIDIPIAAFYTPGRNISVAAPDRNAFLQIFQMMHREKRRKILLILRESLLFFADILTVTEQARSMFGMEITVLAGTENGISNALQALYTSGIHFDGVIFFSTLQKIYRQICESEDMEKCRLMIDQFELFRDMNYTGYLYRFDLEEAAEKLIDHFLQQGTESERKVFIPMQLSFEQYENGVRKAIFQKGVWKS